jgi:hypothetical protein
MQQWTSINTENERKHENENRDERKHENENT